ncbi:MAG TPA: ECF-type sigma factor [Gemmataceae bacterium]|nr:ECF-type sigma factor [Gemmataceae bacterium]
MSSSASVTAWIGQVKAGDLTAAQQPWERYCTRLVCLARAKLPSGRRHGDDEEDVALSAMDSFLRAAGHGRFPNLHGRDTLWALLVTTTVRKAWKVGRREKRLPEVGESALGVPGQDSSGQPGWERALGAEPSPESAYWIAENCPHLLCVVGTVERKLRVIRTIWQKEIAP